MRTVKMSRQPPAPEASAPQRPGRARSLFALLLLLAAVRMPAALALESLTAFPHSALDIQTQAGKQHFDIWVADTPQRSEQGLMFVRSLPAASGMLFPLEHPGVMRMWMKNTLIPLDMLFIDVHGEIIYIQHNATPQSEAIITTPSMVVTPVKAVLELAGGECERRHIQQGDWVIHFLFGMDAR
jgi:uncharacterized membrane protein (UPF0127 family)